MVKNGHTFSSSAEEEKFRVVSVLEELLDNNFVNNILLLIFQNLFPECDHSCKNMDRMFFGGKELIYFDGEAHIALVQLLHPLQESFDVGNHFRENINKFAKRANVLLLNKRAAGDTI